METVVLHLAAPPAPAPRLIATKPSADAIVPQDRSRASCACTDTADVRRMKRTYYARKNELELLHSESVALARKIKKLKADARRRQQPLLNALATKAALQAHVSQNRLLIAGLQALMDANYGSRQVEPPIGSFIHLPRDHVTRQRILNDLKQPKLHEALTFLLQRTASVDLRSPCRQLENYVARDGSHVGTHWEIVLFHSPPGRTLTVAQVFNELLAFLRDQEMAIAETLGLLSVRESDAGDDAIGAKQLRVIAAQTERVTTEKNILLFTEYFDKSDLLDAPHGLVVADYVDKDDAFPYQPETRVRKDIASAKLVVQCPQSSPEEPPVVALVSWAYVSIHKNPLATTSELEAMTRDTLPDYFSALVHVIRERLAWRQQLIGDDV